jgi:hypothetical protein
MAAVGLRWCGNGRRSIEEEIPMQTSKSKRQSRSRSISSKTTGRKRTAIALKTAKLKAGARSAVGQQHRSSTQQQGRAGSKQARIIAMLRASSGANIDDMVHATGWQQHSVRGFLAGVIRKKLGLNLVSEAAENGRIYRITDRTASTVVTAKRAMQGNADETSKIG